MYSFGMVYICVYVACVMSGVCVACDVHMKYDLFIYVGHMCMHVGCVYCVNVLHVIEEVGVGPVMALETVVFKLFVELH